MEMNHRPRNLIFLLAVVTAMIVLWSGSTGTAQASFQGWLNESGDIFPYILQVPIGSLTQVEADNPIGTYLSALYKFFVASAGIVAVVAIMFAGLQRVMSQGNPEAISQSTQRITHAIFGLAIALLSYVILVTINPQLVRLDFAVRNVDFTGNPPNTASTYCPTKFQNATCSSAATYFRPDAQNPSFTCAAVSLSGVVAGCMLTYPEGRNSDLAKLSTDSVYEEMGNGSPLAAKLMQTGWAPHDNKGRTPDQPDYDKWGWTITMKPCTMIGRRDPCYDDPTRQVDCGKLTDFGVEGFRRIYNVGSYCGKSQETGYPLACIIDLNRVDFTGKDGADIGSLAGVTCQPN